MTLRPLEPQTIPWKGCVLHRIHLPRPVRTHLHHTFPLYLQLRKWGEVRDKRRVYVCPTGHDDVHAAIEALLVQAPLPRGVGRGELAMAREAIALFGSGVP